MKTMKAHLLLAAILMSLTQLKGADLERQKELKAEAIIRETKQSLIGQAPSTQRLCAQIARNYVRICGGGSPVGDGPETQETQNLRRAELNVAIVRLLGVDAEVREKIGPLADVEASIEAAQAKALVAWIRK